MQTRTKVYSIGAVAVFGAAVLGIVLALNGLGGAAVSRNAGPVEAPADAAPPVSGSARDPEGEAPLPGPDGAGANLGDMPDPDIPFLGDVQNKWDADADAAIARLRREPIEESVYHLYDDSELPLDKMSTVMYEGSTSVRKHFIFNLLRTRRMSRLAYMVADATPEELEQSVLPALNAGFSKIIERRMEIDAQKEGPRSGGTRFLPPPEGDTGPRGEQTQTSMAALAYLYGLSEHVDALSPLVDIAVNSTLPMAERWPKDHGVPLTEYGGKVVVADAIDKVLVANAGAGVFPEAAEALAQEYLAWREERALRLRGATSIYPYDMGRRPGTVSGTFSGTPDKRSPRTFVLPLAPALEGMLDQQLYVDFMEGHASADQVDGTMNHWYLPYRDRILTQLPDTVEDPAMGLTRRDVIRIVTTGTDILSILENGE